MKLRELFEGAPQFRKSMESLAWQRIFPDSAIRVMEVIEALLFSTNYDKTLRAQLTHNRACADWAQNMADLHAELDSIR